MCLKIKIETSELSKLIDLYLGPNLLDKTPAWQIFDSPISGRGVFAARDIAAGEIILRDQALLAGPRANDTSSLTSCIVCYCPLEGDDQQIMCPKGCTLPVCNKCSDSKRHLIECELFRKWKPKDNSKINLHALRIVTILRCFCLGDLEHKLLYALQANTDKYYMAELKRAADCFEEFPKDRQMLDFFYHTICVFNTNAFEGRSKVEGHEVRVRALFPLAGLVNHQCTPNANHHFEDTETIVITATRPIKQGEEIVTSYTKLFWSTLTRKMFLVMTKHFSCSCQRCLDPTVSLSSFQVFKKKLRSKKILI